MEKGFALRIGAIFIIAVVSAIGVVLPSYIINSNKIKGQEKSENLTESLLFRATKTFSGGVILAVAFCHLLADSQEDLSDDEFTRYVNGYPSNSHFDYKSHPMKYMQYFIQRRFPV